MTKERLIDLEAKQLKLVKQIIKRYVPKKTVWVYGSRVTWKANESSDLDLAIFGCNSKQISRLKSAFEDSNLLISVDVMNWEKIPENFKTNIKQKYVVLQKQTNKTQHNNWKKVKLGDVVTLIGGGTPKTSVKEYWNGDIPWLSVTDFNTGRKYVYDSEKSITEIGLENSNTKILNKADIIISARGTVGIVSVLGKKMAFNQSCYGIRAKDESFNEYIYYLLKNTVNQLQHISHGGVFDKITRDTFNKIEVFLPPLSEQKAIAEVLSSLDDKIQLLHKQNKTLENIAQALFHKWFIEDAKDDWEEGKLGDFLETIESGSRPKGGIDPNLKEGVPSVGAESINGIGNFDFSKTKYISADFFKNMKKGVIKDYDVLIYKDGAYIGKKAMFGQEFPFEKMSVNEHIFILRANRKTNQFFIYFLLNQKELSKLNANSAQPGLNQKAMKSFKIIIPPKNKMDKFGNITKPWVEKILFNSNQIRELEKLREILLSKLMSGKFQVI